MACVDQFLKTKPEIDVERLGITGARESGIMNELVTQPNRFKAAVSMSTLSNLPPVEHVSDPTTPTLIVHESEDPVHDLDRMERTLAWFDRFLRHQGAGPRDQAR